MIRATGRILIGLLTAGLGLPAAAQPSPGRDTTPVEHHFAFSEAEIQDQGVSIDGLVRYRRAGTRPPELTIDLCFPVRVDGGEIDRFAAPLGFSKNVVTAAGPSLLGRVRTEVAITAVIADRRVTLNGEIRYGNTVIKVREQKVDYEDGSGDHLFEGANRTSLQSPNEIVTKLALSAVRPLLDAVRRAQGVVQPAQLIPGCSDYREGKQVVRITVAPARLSALAQAIKAIPGVAEVEGPTEKSMREDAIRLPDRLASGTDRAIVDSFAAVARRSLGAQGATEVKLNAATGEHLVVLTRDTRIATSLGLVEAIAVTLLVAPDPYDAKKRMLYITQVGSKFVDPSATPLQLSQELFESAAYTDIQPRRLSATLSEAFATEVGGEAVSGSGAR